MRTLASTVATLLLCGCAGPSALQVIDNVLSHEGPPPPSFAVVREVLARPLRAMDAARLFERSVPAALVRLAEARPEGPPVALEAAIEPFLRDLAEARDALRAAVPSVPPLGAELPSPALQRQMAASADATQFLDAIARLRRQRNVFPDAGARYARGDVLVIVGTAGDDVHELAALRDGAVRVIIDPGGNDRYLGPDIVLHGLAAIVDLGGDDHYQSDGPAWGSAVAGVSLLLDVSGNDRYEATDFSIGAALAGLGAVIDLAGDDTYHVRAFGQGLGLAGGTGVLWDHDGNDSYRADGLPDPFDRGGGLSFAQGAAVGVRTGMGGGIGILRDDAGDDTYEAQLFAQGAGYYYALGLLWDRGGNDRYRAARYAQGAGVHQAVGVLHDESGNDDYKLTVGVGQGMGLDLAVGALVDVSGDDRYAAPTLAQGAATANGVGIVSDGGGQNEWRLDQPPGRGSAEWSRGLPSVGLVLADAPHAMAPVVHESVARGDCAALQARTLERLRTNVAAALAEVPSEDFDRMWPLALALRCALAGASESQAQAMWDAFENLASTPYAGLITGALHARPAPASQMPRLIERLAAHRSCGVRTAALALDGSAPAAQAALRSSCWQLQARALRILEARGAEPEDASAVPGFLLQDFQTRGKRSESSRSP
jgi:hypothetical protein